MITNGKIQLYPLLRVVVFLIAGILVGDVCYPVMPSWLLLCLTLIPAITAQLLRDKPFTTSILLLCSVFFLGLFVITLRESNEPLVSDLPPSEYQGVIISQPVEHERIVSCNLIVFTSCGNLKMRASIMKDYEEHREASLNIGDGIVFYSSLHAPRQIDNSSRFNYVRWMQVNDFKGDTFISYNNWYKARIDLRRLAITQRARLALLRYRQQIADSFSDNATDEDVLGVLLAMTLGDKSMLSRDTKAVFSSTGSSHILALSGMHLGTFYAFIMLLFGRIRRPFIVQLFALLSIWIYTMLVGMSVSVTRSAIMLTIVGGISVQQRDAVSLNSLAFAAIVLLLYNPLILWDLGFQLSFLSLASIIVCYNTLLRDSFLSSSSRWKSLVAAFLITPLAAQLGTLPVILHVFGNFPTYFFLSNLVVIPAATVVIYTFVVYLLLMPMPSLQLLTGKFMMTVAGVMVALLRYISSLPHSNITNLYITLSQTVCLYLLLICCYGIIYYALKLWKQGKKIKPTAAER